MAYIVTCGEDRLEFNEWEDDMSPFDLAVTCCWRLCFEELQRMADDEEITSKEWRKELTHLNRWYKEIRQEPSKADIFYVFNKPFVYLKEV